MVSWSAQYLVLQSIIRNIFFVLALLSLAGYAQFRFDGEHTQLPQGCDEFGYLQLANQWSNQSVGTQPGFKENLVNHLENEGFDYRDYGWMIAPHAHHWHQESAQVINQYPPALSWMLSWFPKEQRQIWFPGIMAVINSIPLLIIGLFYFNKPHHQLLLVVFLGSLFFFPPTEIEFTRINSLAPTFSWLLAAGLLFRSHPWASTVMASVSLIFRSANVIFIGVFWIVNFVLQRRFDKKSFVSLFVQGALLLVGMVPTMGYQKWLLDDFFAPTYSIIDQSFSGFQQLGSHLSFYFIDEPYWVLPMPLILLAIYFFTRHSQGRYRLIALCVAWSFLMGFFLFHEVTIYYYPYAAVLFGGGVLLPYIFQKINRINRFDWLPLVYLIPIIYSLFKLEKTPNVESEYPYQQCFSSEVIWSDLRSGTVEYTTDALGFRYSWGNTNARDQIILWLAQNNHKQAFWLEDLEVSEVELKTSIEQLGLHLKTRNCELGKLLIVENDR